MTVSKFLGHCTLPEPLLTMTIFTAIIVTMIETTHVVSVSVILGKIYLASRKKSTIFLIL